MQEERYQRDKAAFLARAKALGAEVIFNSANNDEQTQLAAFENMLSQGAQVIVLQPVNTGTAGSMVTSAHKANVKVVGYDAMLVNGPLDAMVMQDSWAVGKLQAEAMVAWLKAKHGIGQGQCRADPGAAGRFQRQRDEQRGARGSQGQPRSQACRRSVARGLVARQGDGDHGKPADQVRQQDRRRDLQQQRHGARRHRRARRPGPGQRREGFRRRLGRRSRQHPICRAGQGSRRNLEEDRPARRNSGRGGRDTRAESGQGSQDARSRPTG